MTLLAIDFGGTRVRAAAYDDAFRQLARAETPTRVEDGQAAVIARIIATAQQVLPIDDAPRAIGIAAPGPLDSKTGTILHAKTLPGWQQVPLAALLSRAFDGAPTFIENDGNLGAVAEYRLGAGQGADPMLYMTISTGIGGGALIGGRLFSGWSGLAVEPGHMQFNLPDGQVRRLEEIASGTALAAEAVRRLATWTAPTTLRDLKPIDGAAVGAAAQQGDALALAIIEQAGRYLGLALVNLIHLFSPEAIVLGGSVSRLDDLLLRPAERVIAERVLDAAFLPPCLLRAAQFGDDVCLLGAALYAAQSIGTR